MKFKVLPSLPTDYSSSDACVTRKGSAKGNEREGSGGRGD